jgi:hypothetical protein
MSKNAIIPKGKSQVAAAVWARRQERCQKEHAGRKIINEVNTFTQHGAHAV